jgi:hypothetical protein
MPKLRKIGRTKDDRARVAKSLRVNCVPFDEIVAQSKTTECSWEAGGPGFVLDRHWNAEQRSAIIPRSKCVVGTTSHGAGLIREHCYEGPKRIVETLDSTEVGVDEFY